MSDVDGPRLATSGEFDEMMELLDRYFAYERGGMAERIPMAYDRDHPDHHAVIVEDDRIVSHVAAIPQTLSLGTGTVECWGIGGVATDRRYRGNGYMSQLLEFWFDRMDEANVPLSELSGNRQRYAHFGYEMAGGEYRYRIDERSFDGETSTSRAVVGYDGSDDRVETLHAIHDAEPYRVVRDRDASRTVYDQRGLETLLFEGADEPAYLSLSRESRSRTVEEFGGSKRGVETLLSHVLAINDLNRLTARVPSWHDLEPVFARHSSYWSHRPHRKVRVCDLPAVLEAARGQLEERWLESGRPEEGSIGIGIEEGASARLSYGPDGVVVDRDGGSPDVELDRTTMTSLLFGMPERTEYLRVGDPFLETALPIRYFVWPTEQV